MPSAQNNDPLFITKRGKQAKTIVWIMFWVLVVVLAEHRARARWFILLFVAFAALAMFAESCYEAEAARIRRFGSKEAAYKDAIDFLHRRPPHDK
jgi:threonine/homoserine/homoserine lactone efflux protein